MADIDLQATDASHEFDGGAIFERIDPEGAGTGQYEPFLTIQHKDTEAGFNSTENGNLDNVDSNGGLDGRTNDLLLSTVPIKVIDGVAYYEFRVDMNEDNNDPIISVESLELYISDSGAVGADFQGIDAADAFLSDDGYTKIFDLDAGGDDRLVLSDVTSSGSGTDDYRFLVPVSLFGDADPATTYVVLYTEMGLADDPLDSSATFEEWRTEIAATINGVKFVDADSDGVKDPGEIGLGGVTVFIDNDRDGVFDVGEVSTVTEADGSFVFYGVTSDHEDGSVWVDEVVPDGYEQTTGTHEVVFVGSGGTVTAEIGNAPQFGSISGTKTADTDNDNDGDDPVQGWTINLYEDEDGDGVTDAEDALLDSTTTAADGSYSFSGLAPGDYIVEEETQTGWQAISATVVGATVTANTDTDVDFINEELGSISGTKTADTDNDDDGDDPVEGWTINLYEDDDGDGVIDAGDALLDSTTTAADGSYSFSGLAPGDYIVEEETQTGWQAVSLTVVGAEVTAGDDTDVDFVNEELGSISGTKTADTDNDDDGDDPVEGWTINLYEDEDGDGVIDAEDALLDTTTTAADGSYSFSGLAPGDYIVEEETQAGWQAVSLTVVGAEVTAGDDTDVDFINEELGSISGTKTADTDNDDDGDDPVEGWAINLYEDEDGDGVIDAEDALLDTTTTAADGSYSFSGLAPGDYIVEEETQAGWQAVSLAVVGAVVTAGADTDVDFVNEEVGSISGTKTADTDNDDDGDDPVEGWTINLYEDDDGDGVIDAEDALLDTTTTAADGSYSFAGLTPGDYIVEEETQTGWQAVSATVFAAAVTAGADTGVDFVNEELGSIIGTKWADTDNDDDGDEGVGGWTINLYEDEDGDGEIDVGVDDLLDTTTTDTDGTYGFADLAPGDYIVEEETQSGWQAVSATVAGATVTAGDATTVDFVNEELASISGYKFADLDEDGVWDDLDGEDGIQGWSISLYADDGDGVLDGDDDFVLTVQTDADGHYAFNDLAPGDYIVVEETQNGWVQTAPNALDADPESGDVNGAGAGFAEFGYAIDLGAGDENDDNDFGNFLLPGSGVRTPGFWGSPNGLLFWDGIEGNETKSGPDFPDGELAPDGYLILGDDGDGIAEAGELKILVEDAQKMINSSNKDQQSMTFMLARDVIATWLNHLAGNPIGDPGDTDSPAYFLDEGVDWLIKYANSNQSGDNTLTANELSAHKVKAKDAAWQIGVSDDGIEAGSAIHNALDQYNNDGSIGLTAFAQDGDNGFSTFEQQYQSMITLQTGTYFV